MKLEEIEALLRAAGGGGFARLDYSEGGFQLSVSFRAGGSPTPYAGSRTAVSEPSAAGRPASVEASRVLSPSVGFFRLRHPAGGALPAEGEEVGADSVVAFVQAGPLLQPVLAGRAGRLGAPLAAEGAGVGFGTPLFTLR